MFVEAHKWTWEPREGAGKELPEEVRMGVLILRITMQRAEAGLQKDRDSESHVNMVKDGKADGYATFVVTFTPQLLACNKGKGRESCN